MSEQRTRTRIEVYIAKRTLLDDWTGVNREATYERFRETLSNALRDLFPDVFMIGVYLTGPRYQTDVLVTTDTPVEDEREARNALDFVYEGFSWIVPEGAV